jgi:hypothetical protein
MRCQNHFFALFLVLVGSCYAQEATPSNGDLRSWVKEALKAGEQLVEAKQDQEPLERIESQWEQYGRLQVQKGEELERQMGKLPKNEEMPSKLRGEMMLFFAYASFAHPDMKDIVMKRTEDKGLICHLVFRTTNDDLVDIAYCYDEQGALQTLRIDSAPKDVFVSIPNGEKTDRFLLVYFKSADVTIALDRLNPFAAVATDL